MFAVNLVLWIIAYTAGTARLFLAFIYRLRKPSKGDFWKIAFLLSFTLLIISLSNMETLRQLRTSGSQLFGSISLYGISAITLTLPLYIQSQIRNLKFRDMRNGLFIGLAGFSTILITVALILNQMQLISVIFFVTSTVMAATIVYSMILLARHAAEDPVSGGILKVLGFSVMILIPVMIWVDFIASYMDGYIMLPLIYLLVNILMMSMEIKDLLSGLQSRNISVSKMNHYGLTRREQEVAGKLVNGCTHQQAAEDLFISIQTMKTHANNIYTKTACRNRMELVQKICD